MDQEKVFGEVLNRKEAYLDYKKKNIYKGQKNDNFSKWVSLRFLSKNEIFHSFLLKKQIIKKKRLVKI